MPEGSQNPSRPISREALRTICAFSQARASSGSFQRGKIGSSKERMFFVIYFASYVNLCYDAGLRKAVALILSAAGNYMVEFCASRWPIASLRILDFVATCGGQNRERKVRTRSIRKSWRMVVGNTHRPRPNVPFGTGRREDRDANRDARAEMRGNPERD
jgi:hypothetical protein